MHMSLLERSRRGVTRDGRWGGWGGGEEEGKGRGKGNMQSTGEMGDGSGVRDIRSESWERSERSDGKEGRVEGRWK